MPIKFRFPILEIRKALNQKSLIRIHQAKTPGYPAHLDLVNVTQNTNPTSWRVRFEYGGEGRGDATLTLGFASAVKAGVRAVVNGQEVLKISAFEGPKGDSSLFKQYVVTFRGGLLKRGENVLEFTPPGAVSANHFDHMVMWDFLKLEAQE